MNSKEDKNSSDLIRCYMQQVTQPGLASSKAKMEIPEQCVKPVQSY